MFSKESCVPFPHVSAMPLLSVEVFRSPILSCPSVIHFSTSHAEMEDLINSPSPDLAVVHEAEASKSTLQPTVAVHGLHIASPPIGLLSEASESEMGKGESLVATFVVPATNPAASTVDLTIYTAQNSAVVSVLGRRLSDAYQPISPASSDNNSSLRNNDVDDDDDEEPIVDVVGCSDSDRDTKVMNKKSFK